ncbi:MAG: tetratricopeptide repeat protein, partial [Gammaproteobacteria bacterium]|nr:tetratricopeptide repeat protein [Gammaproteobacteria bacterium]
KGQAPAAVPMFQKALRLDPRNPEATCGLAGCFLDMGRFEDGRSWLAKTLEIDPAFARAYHLSAHSGLFDADDPVF